MDKFLGIIGILLALPILLILVVLVAVTLIGGYAAALLYYGWRVLLAILALILIIKIFIWIFKKF